MFKKLRADLPFFTQLVVNISDGFRKYWGVSLILLVLAIVFYKKYNTTERGRYRIDFLKLKLPLVGRLIFTAILARFMHSFSLLVEGGVPIAQCLDDAKKSCDNRVVEEKLDFVRDVYCRD